MLQEKNKILFCNVGWMSRYEGFADKPDKLVGGGSYVRQTGRGGEVCNFVACDDGYVYGHVETIHGEIDRRIYLEDIGGSGEAAEGVDVVWTATDPDKSGRKIVGCYQNATVFRERQSFTRPPSKQHKKDGTGSFRIRALSGNVRRLEVEERVLSLPRGKGWMGRNPWWFPGNSGAEGVDTFVEQVRGLLQAPRTATKHQSANTRAGGTPAPASSPYSRYVEEFETTILPRHSDLQGKFEGFLKAHGATDLRPNVSFVDLRFQDSNRNLVFAEVKPCNRNNARFAIRTAIGQLLDYRQREQVSARLLIVLEVEPDENDKALAASNGFGLAYPSRTKFQMRWPD